MAPSAVDGGENPAARGPEETTDEEHAAVVRKIEAKLGTKLSTTDASYHARDGAHVVVVSGPSGVGKDTVLRRLQEKRPDLLFVVTATSRAKRPGEVEGVDYFFVSKDEFERMIHDQELIEHAVVYGEYKGIPKKQVRQRCPTPSTRKRTSAAGTKDDGRSPEEDVFSKRNALWRKRTPAALLPEIETREDAMQACEVDPPVQTGPVHGPAHEKHTHVSSERRS